MRKVSIVEFRANMAQELKNLPFALISHGKVITICTDPKEIKCTDFGKCTDSPIEKCTELPKKVIPIDKSVQIEYSAVWSGGYSKERQTRKKAK